MSRKIKKLLSAVLALIYPERCVFCREFNNTIACESCHNGHTQVAGSTCNLCGCGSAGCKCGGTANAYYSGLAAPFYYEGQLAQRILAYKYRGKHNYGKYFSRQMADIIKSHYKNVNFDAIVCVPMFKQPNAKDFDHALDLAKRISAETKIKLIKNALTKTAGGTRQHMLNHDERRANVKGLYKADATHISGKRILLIDDIATTGATLDQCANQILIAGAKEVYCAVTAITKLRRNVL